MLLQPSAVIHLATCFITWYTHALIAVVGIGWSQCNVLSPSAWYGAGEVVTDKECEQRMQLAKQMGEPHFYMMELSPGLIIDARDKGNVARLINSSCAPNCQSQKWHDAATGERHLT